MELNAHPPYIVLYNKMDTLTKKVFQDYILHCYSMEEYLDDAVDPGGIYKMIGIFNTIFQEPPDCE